MVSNRMKSFDNVQCVHMNFDYMVQKKKKYVCFQKAALLYHQKQDTSYLLKYRIDIN